MRAHDAAGRSSPALGLALSASAVKSFLVEQLGAQADEVRVTYVSWERRPSDTPLRVTWTPPERGSIGSSFGEPGAEVWIAPVAKVDLHRARSWISSAILPDLASWLRTALGARPGKALTTRGTGEPPRATSLRQSTEKGSTTERAHVRKETRSHHEAA